MKLNNAILAITWILIPIIDGYLIATKGPKILCFIFSFICGVEMYLEYKILNKE